MRKVVIGCYLLCNLRLVSDGAVISGRAELESLTSALVLRVASSRGLARRRPPLPHRQSRRRDGRRAAPVRARKASRALAIRQRQTVSFDHRPRASHHPIQFHGSVPVVYSLSSSLVSSRHISPLVFPPPLTHPSPLLTGTTHGPPLALPWPVRTTPGSMSLPCDKSPSRHACAA